LFIGNNLVCIAVISGLVTVVLANPSIRMTLLIISAAYLGYLAFRIAFSGAKIAFIQMPKPGLVSGASIQLINPKAYAVHIILFSGFAFFPNNFFIETTIKLLIANVIWILIHLLWLYLGFKINQLELPKKIQGIINVFMAICLLAVVGLSVWSITR
jgi:threonine/homoserine/homoserine lactone efflux protein